jgi:hypothetical protein
MVFSGTPFQTPYYETIKIFQKFYYELSKYFPDSWEFSNMISNIF